MSAPAREQYIATYAYEARRPGELSFAKRDIVTVTSKTPTWWVAELNGASGKVPSNFFEPLRHDAYVALYSYTAARECELSFRAGDALHVLHTVRGQSQWLKAEHASTGSRGLVPSTFIFRQDAVVATPAAPAPAGVQSTPDRQSPATEDDERPTQEPDGADQSISDKAAAENSPPETPKAEALEDLRVDILSPPAEIANDREESSPDCAASASASPALSLVSVEPPTTKSPKPVSLKSSPGAEAPQSPKEEAREKEGMGSWLLNKASALTEKSKRISVFQISPKHTDPVLISTPISSPSVTRRTGENPLTTRYAPQYALEQELRTLVDEGWQCIVETMTYRSYFTSHDTIDSAAVFATLGPRVTDINGLVLRVDGFTQKLSGAIRQAREFPKCSEELLLQLAKAVDIVMAFDVVKDTKTSLSNDFSLWKRARSVVKQESNLSESSIQNLHVFLSTPSALTEKLVSGLPAADPGMNTLTLVLGACMNALDSGQCLSPEEQFMYCRASAFVMYLLCRQDQARAILKHKSMSQYSKIWKKMPAVPIVGDVKLFLTHLFEQSNTFDEKIRSIFVPDSRLSRVFMDFLPSLATFRTEYAECTENLSRVLKAVRGGNVRFDAASFVCYEVLSAVVQALKLASKWAVSVVTQHVWKLSNPALVAETSEFEAAVRYNYSPEESSCIAEMVGGIKSIVATLKKHEPLLREIFQDLLKGMVMCFITKVTEEVIPYCNRKKIKASDDLSLLGFFMSDHKSSLSKADLFVIRSALGAFLKEGKKELQSGHWKIVEEFYLRLQELSYVDDLTSAAEASCSMHDLYFTERHLDCAKKARFDIEVTLPFLISTHVLLEQTEASDPVEYLLSPIEVFRDAARYLKDKFPAVLNEVDASLGEYFTKITEAVSAQIYVESSYEAQRILKDGRLSSESELLTMARRVPHSRYEPLMALREVQLLKAGSIDYNVLISQQVSVRLRKSCIAPKDSELMRARLTYEILHRQLQLDPWECYATASGPAPALGTATQQATMQVSRPQTSDDKPRHNSGDRRSHKGSLPAKPLPQRPPSAGPAGQTKLTTVAELEVASPQSVATWLQSLLSLEDDCVKVLLENRIRWATLCDLDVPKLQALGMKMGDADSISRAVKKMLESATTTSAKEDNANTEVKPEPPKEPVGRFGTDQSEHLTYKGPLAFAKGYTPKVGCREGVLAATSELSDRVPRLADIVANCVKAAESTMANPASKEQIDKFHLSEDEVLAMTLYTYDLGATIKSTQNFYYNLNMIIRYRATEDMRVLQPYIYYLNSALRKLPNFKGVVYRGNNSPVLAKREYLVGRQIFWSSFTSTTTAERIAALFAGSSGVIFRITVSSGKVINAFSVVKNENEVLLPPNACLVVSREAYVENGHQYIDLIEVSGRFRW